MDVSHLFDDSFRGGPSIALDVKEKLRTREINAREERNLEKWSSIFQRGKEICERSASLEKWKVYRALHILWERTPRLEKSLAEENVRVEALRSALLSRTNPQIANRLYTNSSQINAVMDVSRERSRQDAETKGGHRRKYRDRPLNTNLGLKSHTHKQANCVKMNQHVVRFIARLNKRQERRERNLEEFKGELLRISQPLIERARVVLRGHPDIDSNQYLDDLENYLSYGSSYRSHGITTADTSGEDSTRTNVLRLQDNEELNSVLEPLKATTGRVVEVDGGNMMDHNTLHDRDQNGDAKLQAGYSHCNIVSLESSNDTRELNINRLASHSASKITLPRLPAVKVTDKDTKRGTLSNHETRKDSFVSTDFSKLLKTHKTRRAAKRGARRDDSNNQQNNNNVDGNSLFTGRYEDKLLISDNCNLNNNNNMEERNMNVCNCVSVKDASVSYCVNDVSKTMTKKGDSDSFSDVNSDDSSVTNNKNDVPNCIDHCMDTQKKYIIKSNNIFVRATHEGHSGINSLPFSSEKHVPSNEKNNFSGKTISSSMSNDNLNGSNKRKRTSNNNNNSIILSSSFKTSHRPVVYKSSFADWRNDTSHRNENSLFGSVKSNDTLNSHNKNSTNEGTNTDSKSNVYGRGKISESSVNGNDSVKNQQSVNVNKSKSNAPKNKTATNKHSSNNTNSTQFQSITNTDNTHSLTTVRGKESNSNHMETNQLVNINNRSMVSKGFDTTDSDRDNQSTIRPKNTSNTDVSSVNISNEATSSGCQNIKDVPSITKSLQPHDSVDSHNANNKLSRTSTKKSSHPNAAAESNNAGVLPSRNTSHTPETHAEHVLNGSKSKIKTNNVSDRLNTLDKLNMNKVFGLSNNRDIKIQHFVGRNKDVSTINDFQIFLNESREDNRLQCIETLDNTASTKNTANNNASTTTNNSTSTRNTTNNRASTKNTINNSASTKNTTNNSASTKNTANNNASTITNNSGFTKSTNYTSTSAKNATNKSALTKNMTSNSESTKNTTNNSASTRNETADTASTNKTINNKTSNNTTHNNDEYFPIYKSEKIEKSTKHMGSAFSPPPTVPHVILEEEEEISESPSFNHQNNHHTLPEMDKHSRKMVHESGINDKQKTTKNEQLLNSAQCLPLLWKQSGRQLKNMSYELSLLSIARTHRRSRQTRRM